MSLVDLYMKELLMQQKLHREYFLQQQLYSAQNVHPSHHPQQLNYPSSSSSSMLSSSSSSASSHSQLFFQNCLAPPLTSSSSSSSPLLLAPIPSFPPYFAATASASPGTAGPFAAAPYCAAKPMALASLPQQQSLRSCQENTTNSQGIFESMFLTATGTFCPSFAQMATQMLNFSGTTFPPMFSDFGQSPSCGSSLTSADSCTSLDSFPSPSDSSGGSPDSNSCSSLNGPLPSVKSITVPSVHAKHSFQNKLPSSSNGNTNKPTLPIDFSEMVQKTESSAQQRFKRTNKNVQPMGKSVAEHCATAVLCGQKRQNCGDCVEAGHQQQAPPRKVRRSTVFVPIGTARKLSSCPTGSGSVRTPTSSTVCALSSIESTTSVATSSSCTSKATCSPAPIVTNDCATAAFFPSTSTSCSAFTTAISSAGKPMESVKSEIIECDGLKEEHLDEFIKSRELAVRTSSLNGVSELLTVKSVEDEVDHKGNESNSVVKLKKMEEKLLEEIVPSSEESASEKENRQKEVKLEQAEESRESVSSSTEERVKKKLKAIRKASLSPKKLKKLPLKRNKSEEDRQGSTVEEDEDKLTMEGKDEDEEEVERTVLCCWLRCKKRFVDDDQLYDHLATDHVEALSKAVLAEQREQLEQQAKAEEKSGVRRRRSNDAGTAAERFRCRWRKCAMHARRGDAQKKIDWLLNHLVIRHSPKARPHKCLFAPDCPLRFKKLQALKDHLRSAHDDLASGKGNGRKNGMDAARAKMAWFEFRPRVCAPIIRDCIDARTVEWVRRRLDVAYGGLNGDAEAGTDFFAITPVETATNIVQNDILIEPSAGPSTMKQTDVERKVEFVDSTAENSSASTSKGQVARIPLKETIAHLRNIFPVRKTPKRITDSFLQP